jgi:hypothetical protein
VVAPLIVAHVLGSFVVGWAGRRRRVGFLGFLIVSLLVTPILGLLILFISAPKVDAKPAA